MNYYETLYIVHPALESGRLKDIVSSIDDIFKNSDLNVISIDVWGKKKLAYLIEKQKYGTYVLVQFESNGQSNGKLSFELETNPNVLSHLTSKISETDLQKDLPSLDDQIHGSRPISSEAKEKNNEEVKKVDSDNIDNSSNESDKDKTTEVNSDTNVENNSEAEEEKLDSNSDINQENSEEKNGTDK